MRPDVTPAPKSRPAAQGSGERIPRRKKITRNNLCGPEPAPFWSWGPLPPIRRAPPPHSPPTPGYQVTAGRRSHVARRARPLWPWRPQAPVW